MIQTLVVQALAAEIAAGASCAIAAKTVAAGGARERSCPAARRV
jgi:hypothetical protein